MAQNLGVFPAESKPETVVPAQCPEFYAEDTLILSQCILWEFHQKVSEDLLVVNYQLHVDLGDDPHQMETASYYLSLSVTLLGLKFSPTLQEFVSNLPVSNSRSFTKVATCNTGRLCSKISNLVNEKSTEPATGLRPDTCPEKLPNTNNQIGEQRNSEVCSTVVTNEKLSTSDARSLSKVTTCATAILGSKVVFIPMRNAANLPKAQEMALDLKTCTTLITKLSNRKAQ
ncbi:hypothetical protein DSO57_1007766 [Entomophthora muscae]|uniref:Uncharacterized protein n=1 Tax=Entomophthora muscae TaxID=34485 RepID=A0ACC2USR7_9FUNG|nr:hypothetical protein DSO57_1007766 [Entomophthora muscae]